MPVITPAYPSMCATFNITRSSMTIIGQELERGLEITEEIMVGKRPWSDLFVKHTFFTEDYKYYISVISASKTKEQHKVWSGFVESKVRMLVQKLEQHPEIAVAHPFNKGYERRHRCKTDDEIRAVQDGSLDYLAPAKEESNEDDSKSSRQDSTTANGTDAEPSEVDIFTTTHYIGLELAEGKHDNPRHWTHNPRQDKFRPQVSGL
jgi:poly(A) polymerase